jgi:hypothetical protein
MIVQVKEIHMKEKEFISSKYLQILIRQTQMIIMMILLNQVHIQMT